MNSQSDQKNDKLTSLLLRPLLRMLRFWKKSIERLISVREMVSRSDLIEEELQDLIKEGLKDGVMDKEDERLLQSVIEFGDTLAREVMIPRMDMVALDSGTSLEEVLATVIKVGHTRLPVYRKDIDHIVGILHAKDLLKVWQSGKTDISTEELLRPVIFFSEDRMISVLLREIKKSRTHLAIIVDEFGGTAGMITLEDLVEEIIGEVSDEFDGEEGELVRKIDEGWMVDARTGLRVLEEELDLPDDTMKKGEAETVGGLMTELLGRQPRSGDELEVEGCLFRVVETDGRRIRRLLVRVGK